MRLRLSILLLMLVLGSAALVGAAQNPPTYPDIQLNAGQVTVSEPVFSYCWPVAQGNNRCDFALERDFAEYTSPLSVGLGQPITILINNAPGDPSLLTVSVVNQPGLIFPQDPGTQALFDDPLPPGQHIVQVDAEFADVQGVPAFVSYRFAVEVSNEVAQAPTEVTEEATDETAPTEESEGADTPTPTPTTESADPLGQGGQGDISETATEPTPTEESLEGAEVEATEEAEATEESASAGEPTPTEETLEGEPAATEEVEPTATLTAEPTETEVPATPTLAPTLTETPTLLPPTATPTPEAVVEATEVVATEVVATEAVTEATEPSEEATETDATGTETTGTETTPTSPTLTPSIAPPTFTPSAPAPTETATSGTEATPGATATTVGIAPTRTPAAGEGGSITIAAPTEPPALQLIFAGQGFSPAGVNFCQLEAGQQVCVNRPLDPQGSTIALLQGEAMQVRVLEGGRPASVALTYINADTQTAVSSETRRGDRISLFNITPQPGTYILRVSIDYGNTDAEYFFQVRVVN